MRLPSPSIALGASVLALCGATTGCAVESGGESGPPGGYTEVTGNPRTMDIDTGATLMVSGGAGVGIFAEVGPDGKWAVFTACDTNTSGLPCDIDVFAATVDPKASISNVEGADFQSKDAIEVQPDGVVHMFVETSTSLDGMTFDVTPGATLQLAVLLGGESAPQFVYWVGDGVLHTGAPTDPINLAPVTPDGGAGGGDGG